MSSPLERARQLATLEAALAAELTRTRTMTLAAERAPTTADLQDSVAAWISDWKEFHESQTVNPILRAAIPVAISQVSAQRVAAAVWYFHRQERPANPAPESAGDSPAPATPATPGTVAVSLPAHVSPKRPARIVINGAEQEVAACVAGMLAGIKDGRVRMRPETLRKLPPELARCFVRDKERKAVAKFVWYQVQGLRVGA